MFKGFFFDLDGTLVDSEHLGEEVFLKFKDEFYPVPKGEFNEVWCGKSTLHAFEEFVERYGKSKDLLERFYSRYLDILENVKPLPGAFEILEVCKQLGELALVTGSNEDQVRKILNVTGLEKYFSVVVSHKTDRQGKPDPAQYLEASSITKVSPRDCLIFENAEVGVLAGKRAGMTVWGFSAGNKSPQNLNNCDKKFLTLKDALDEIKRGDIVFR